MEFEQRINETNARKHTHRQQNCAFQVCGKLGGTLKLSECEITIIKMVSCTFFSLGRLMGKSEKNHTKNTWSLMIENQCFYFQFIGSIVKTALENRKFTLTKNSFPFVIDFHSLTTPNMYMRIERMCKRKLLAYFYQLLNFNNRSASYRLLNL